MSPLPHNDSEWKDLLTSYGGQTITYDAIGNPLTYRDGITLTWQNGRRLASYSDANYDITYTYDVNGMRTSKVINDSSEVNYVYENGLLLQMDFNGYIFDISYDVNGSPIGFRLDNGSYYYYGTNSRGDIIAIYNQSGTKLATYSYDAYGKFLGTTYTSTTNYNDNLAIDHNPLRYRGYVYDRETGFYYLQTRYYDPTTCRFINGDSQLNIDSFNGFNQFTYCNNNSIMFIDPNGKDAIILYDDDFVGHIGALVEDENGNWWHSYWGAPLNGTAIFKSIASCCYDACFIDNIGKQNLSTNTDLLGYINNLNVYSGDYEDYHYLYGDYSNSLEYLSNPSQSYGILTNNCSQFTFRALSKSYNHNYFYLSDASHIISPKKSFKYAQKYVMPISNSLYKKLTFMETRL